MSWECTIAVMILDLNYKPQNEIRNTFNSIKGLQEIFLKILFDYT